MEPRHRGDRYRGVFSCERDRPGDKDISLMRTRKDQSLQFSFIVENSIF